jgi:hypothetical protein
MWEVENYEHPIELKQSAVNDIAYTFASLYAERVIEEETPDDLESYGLKDPVVTAEATLKDGTKKVLYLGNKTATGTYYLMAQDDPRVFEVWMNHGEHLMYTLADVRDMSLPEINIQEFTYFKMIHEGTRPIEIKVNDDQSEDEAQYGLGLWQMVQPYNEPMGVDSEGFQKILESIPNISINEFVEDAPEDLGKYGLDEPASELVVKDNENTLHLYFGSDADEDKVYCKTADSDTVYTVNKAILEFMDTDPFSLVEKFAFIVNIDNVDKIVVEGGGKTHTLTLSRTTKEAQEEGEEDEVVTTYNVDGQDVEEDPFKKYYQSLIGILVDAENDKEIEEEPEVKTTFYLNKGGNREIHVNYVPYNDEFYAVFRSGKAEFVVHRGQVEKMLEDLEALIRGDLVEEE